MSKKITVNKFFSDSTFKIYIEQFGIKDKIPIVIIPGAYHTGLHFTAKLDGSESWVDYLQQNYCVYVTDLPGHGRSGYISFKKINGNFIVEAYKAFIMKFETPVILMVHSMAGPYGFKLIEELPEGKISHFIGIEPGPFGNNEPIIVPVEESNDCIKIIYKGIPINLNIKEMAAPSKEFLMRVMNKKITSFTQNPQERDQYIASLQSVHPQLFYERFNIHGSQLKIYNFDRLATCNYLIITSALDPLHKDEDTTLTNELRKHDLNVEHWRLDTKGIYGNGHMMMLEKNSDKIISLIEGWLRKSL